MLLSWNLNYQTAVLPPVNKEYALNMYNKYKVNILTQNRWIKSNLKQVAHGPHRSPEKTVQINKHIWLYHNIDRRKKNIHFILTYCFFIWILTQGCVVPKLGEIGSVVLEKKIFYTSSMYFRYFCNNLPLEKGGVLHLNKLESPSPKDVLCQVWLKLAQWFWRWRFCQCIFAISQLSPFAKGRGPSTEQTWIPFTQGWFVPSLVEIGPLVLKKKMDMWKVYRRTDGQTHRRTTGDQKSSLELSAQVS